MTYQLPLIEPDVLIIGGGPAGLTAAAELADRRAGHILCVDREHAAGGIPRHSDHTGYGLRDLHRVMSGPVYARHLVDRATRAKAEIRTNTMVTGWSDEHTLDVTSPDGRYQIRPRAIVLATGARERPRTARRIPGDRPHGVYTTGQLQNLVHLHHQPVGKRAVIVGGELVSWSAALTLRQAGCTPALMISQYPKAESYGAFNAAGRTVLRVPVATRSRVTKVIGKGRCQAVEIEHLDTGKRRTVACDTVVFTGDWIPDHELVRAAGIALDESTLGPLTDTALRTSRPGVFAVGNMLHPVDTADVAALDGKHVAQQVINHLHGQQPPTAGVRLTVGSPFRWVAPQILRPDDPAPARGRLLLWPDEFVRFPKVTVRQDGRVITRRTLAWPAAPGRVFRIPSTVLDGISHTGGPVHISL
ncbi:NAD(P)/FAD-dependent oxidoreductase [Streptomyces scopuliridis]|uniref:FAD-dependent pyridine nucleotide-disulfide oxidoreductase n=1 Tax=Streptomyces scopuliridis RB72 TaxID=1440053 RepID=A0A2T7TDG3_9ACTN|nr:FAD-dependent oxidoreductase [Streptomyces scopuliridis]PVE13204.1 FAD-dependent pyridine nucleotide-disulfide oxidoreductase [Streptomyces scopuliridis RB72]